MYILLLLYKTIKRKPLKMFFSFLLINLHDATGLKKYKKKGGAKGILKFVDVSTHVKAHAQVHSLLILAKDSNLPYTVHSYITCTH